MINNAVPHSSAEHKHKGVGKKLNKFLKQYEQHQEEKNFEPGKVEIQNSDTYKLKVVNFFGDVHTEVYCMDTDFEDGQVAVGCSNGDIKVYTISEGKLQMMGNTSRLSGYPNTGVRWNPKSKQELAACNCDGTIKWYDTQQQIAVGHHESDSGYLCLDYNCDGSWIALANEKYELEVYDSVTKKLTKKFQAGALDSLNPNHTNRIFSVKTIKNNPNMFFSGGWDATVRLWDVRAGEGSVRRFGGPMVSADSLDLKGDVLLAGNYSTKQTVQLWDFNSGQLIKNVDLREDPTETMYCFAAEYAHKSKFNLSAVGLSGINKVKLLENGEVKAQLKLQAAPLSLHFYRFHDNDFLLVSGVEGTIYSIKIKIEV